MDKIEKTEPKIEFDVDDPDTWPEDDDNSDSIQRGGGLRARRADSLCESPCAGST